VNSNNDTNTSSRSSCPAACAQCPDSCPTCSRTDLCFRTGCPSIIADGRCGKKDCTTKTAPARPPNCTGHSETCPVCNPAESVRACAHCDWVGTADDWPTHPCEGEPGEDGESWEILTPRVAHLTIEVLGHIRLNLTDPHRVTHIADGSQLPVNRVGVMRVLKEALDQDTADAITAELTRLTAMNAKAARPDSLDDILGKVDTEELGASAIARTTHALRTHINNQMAVAK
jgi:hypothetical protein